MRGVVVLALALGLVPTALATHPGWVFTPRMNLDGDSVRERLVATYDTHPNQASIYVVDECRGRELRHELAAPGIFMYRASIHGSRDLGRPGVLFSIQYEDGHSIARVGRLRIQQPGECPSPVVLFDYSTLTPPLPPPRGLVPAGFDVSVGEFSTRYAGRELRLRERYTEREGGPTRARRLTFYRYRKATARYERYRKVLERS